MSLLEKFVLLFETDAGESAKEVRQLNESLGGTDEEAKAATKQVDNLKQGLKDLIAAYVGVRAIKAAVFDMARADDSVAKFSNTLGFNIEQIDAYSAAVERSGGSAESFRGSIAGLKSQLDDLQNYGSGDIAQTLSRIGVNAVDSTGKIKNAMSLLPDLAKAFEGMSADESSFYGKKLGLDQGTIALLQQSRYAMQNLVEQQRQLGGRTKETTKAAEDFNDRIDNGSRLFQSFFTKANATILPVLTDLIDRFYSVGDWIKKNKDLVTGFIIIIGGAITASLIPVMWRLAAATTAATWPFLLIAGVIAAVGVAFALVYEDIKFYINGQKSLIGDLLNKYKWLGKGIKAALEVIKQAFDVLKKDIEWFGTLFTNPQEAINQLKDGIMELIKLTKEWLGLDDKKKKTELDPNAEDLPIFDKNNVIKKTPDSQDLPIFGNDNIIKNTKKGLAMQSEYAASPINSMSKSTALNSQNRNQNINITLGEIRVNASGMSVGEAQSVFGDSLRNEISNALGYLNDGVVA